MQKQHAQHITAYLKKIKAANKELTKKEHFKDLLHHFNIMAKKKLKP